MRDVKILEARKQLEKIWPSKERNPKPETYLFHRISQKSRHLNCAKDPRRQQCRKMLMMGGQVETV